MPRLARALVPVFALVLAVAACSDDDDDTAAPTGPTAAAPAGSSTVSGTSGASSTVNGTSGASSPASASDFCATVRQAAGETQSTSTGSTIDTGDLGQVLDRLEATAPPELGDDFATMQRALDEIGDLDQATAADIQRVLRDVPDLLGAIGAITDYAHDQCGVDLSFVDQLFGQVLGGGGTTSTR
jgi:hypothetical protein